MGGQRAGAKAGSRRATNLLNSPAESPWMQRTGSGTLIPGMQYQKLRRQRFNQSRLVVGMAVLCAAALAPALSMAAGSGVDPGTRLAYVDPGSGSFILQALVATLAGAAVAINAYWAKIRRLFGRGVPEEDDDTKVTTPNDD